MALTSITVQLDAAVQIQLAELAEARHQPVADLAAEAISQFVAVDTWERNRIRTGLAELRSDQGVSDEEVTKWLDSWGTENELPAPR